MRRARDNYPAAKEGLGDCVRISGNFTTAGAGSPTVFSSGPFTVAHSATGQYTVTFQEMFKELLCVNCKIAGATDSNDDVLLIAASTSAGTSTAFAVITLETQSVAGTHADLTGPVVHFEAIWRKGKLTK
jgi:hypothetical protein